MKDKEGKGTSGSAMAGLLCAQLEATAIYLGHPAAQQQKSDWMELDTGALLRESQLAREAVQLKQTLELGEHVRREIEKEQMRKDAPEGMLS